MINEIKENIINTWMNSKNTNKELNEIETIIQDMIEEVNKDRESLKTKIKLKFCK
jgi:hypothetical protein